MARCEVCGRPWDDEELLPREVKCGGCHTEFEIEKARMNAALAEWKAFGELKPKAQKKMRKEGTEPAEPTFKAGEVVPIARQTARNAHAEREMARGRALKRQRLERNSRGYHANQPTVRIKAFTDKKGRTVTVAQVKARTKRALALMDAEEA